jgi:hypothetical protein
MQIGILYMCAGKYLIFWKSFYESSEKYFFTNQKKTYFVFTDAKKIDFQDNDNVVKIYQKDLGWPDISMMRFKMFTLQQQILKKTDYLFFCNANLLFVDFVGDEILPVKEGLLVLKHPGFWNLPREKFTYDTNPACSAYIAPHEGEHYFIGAFNGGKTENFLQMSQILADNIDNDLLKGIIALWFDESHLNKYVIDKPVKILDPSYGYAEGWDLPFKPKIVILDKGKILNVNKLKGVKEKESAKKTLKRKINSIAKFFR